MVGMLHPSALHEWQKTWSISYCTVQTLNSVSKTYSIYSQVHVSILIKLFNDPVAGGSKNSVKLSEFQSRLKIFVVIIW